MSFTQHYSYEVSTVHVDLAITAVQGMVRNKIYNRMLSDIMMGNLYDNKNEDEQIV